MSRVVRAARELPRTVIRGGEPVEEELLDEARQRLPTDPRRVAGAPAARDVPLVIDQMNVERVLGREEEQTRCPARARDAMPRPPTAGRLPPRPDFREGWRGMGVQGTERRVIWNLSPATTPRRKYQGGTGGWNSGLGASRGCSSATNFTSGWTTRTVGRTPRRATPRRLLDPAERSGTANSRMRPPCDVPASLASATPTHGRSKWFRAGVGRPPTDI
jgi:hypothetical protein